MSVESKGMEKSNRSNHKLNLMDSCSSQDETKENVQLICRTPTDVKEYENIDLNECGKQVNRISDVSVLKKD